MKNIAIKVIIVTLMLVAATMAKSAYYERCTYRSASGSLVIVSSEWHDGMARGEIVEWLPNAYGSSLVGILAAVHEEKIFSGGEIIKTTSIRISDDPKITRTLYPVKMTEKQYKKSLVKRGDGNCLDVMIGERLTDYVEIPRN